MANITKKLQAQELRRKGWSISEIAEKLNMHKGGSISKWCQDIVLTQEQIERLVGKQESGSYRGRIIATEKIRKQLENSSFLAPWICGADLPKHFAQKRVICNITRV